MAEEGYIKLYRQIRHNWIWQNPEYLRAWLDLLLSASHEEYKTVYKGEVRNVAKGTIHRSFSSLAIACGWSRKRVRHFIGLLERDGMVTTKVSTNDTMLTIANWDFFQVEKKKRNSKGSNEGINEGINEGTNEGTTNKNVKKVEEGKEASSRRATKKSYLERKADRDRAFEEAMKEIAEMRKNAEEKEENYGEE